MRYLVVGFSVLCLVMISVASIAGESPGMPQSEQEVFERLEGAWVEDVDGTLEKINERLMDESLDAQTRMDLEMERRVLLRSDLVTHIGADGAVRVEGVIGNSRVEETGSMDVISVENDHVKVTLTGEHIGAGGEIPVYFEDNHFVLYINGIKRRYARP